MAKLVKQGKVKLDRKGLSGLGVDRLVDILLEEATANKSLKARLLTALAGEAGPDEMARVIDKRLASIDAAVTRINKARARDMAEELSALARNILSELGSADKVAAGDRILRFLTLRFSISARLVTDSARMWKVFDDAEQSTLDLLGSVESESHVAFVDAIETLRLRDRYGEHTGFLHRLAAILSEPAALAWRKRLAVKVGNEHLKHAGLYLMQALALRHGDLDAVLQMERQKPENRQDSLAMAQVLYDAGRFDEALEWVRMRPPKMRLIMVAGVTAGVGPDYGAAERRLLEADILERLKRRDDAQELRWREFSETLNPAVLRLYLSKLDDFAEFDEMDRAFALVRNHEAIYLALDFFMEWPRLDLAADLVLRREFEWEGLYFEDLGPIAEALSAKEPVAATVLYRRLITDILARGISVGYIPAARYVGELARLEPQLPSGHGLSSHAAFVEDLKRSHPKKYSFWSAVPGGLKG